MRRPDLFLVGAPKCGTTAMDTYLKRHPEIFMARKELHYFGSDLPHSSSPTSEQAYLRHFSSAGASRRVGESSVWYLYSEEAAREIHSFEPDARILILLRDPVEMLPALHSELLFTGDEDLPDFEDALDAEAERRVGRRLRKGRGGRSEKLLFYSQVALYSRQVERYLETFGGERVRVELFDDLRADTGGVYRRVLSFLEVDTEFAPAFEVVNPSKGVRFPWLHRLRHSYPAWVARVGRTLLPSLRVRRGLARTVERLYTRPQPRPPISPRIRQRIWGLVADDVDRLEDLIGRDLSAWGERG